MTITDLTVQNGNTLAEGQTSGGGIFNGVADKTGGPLTLRNVTIANNASTFGGGIMNGWGASMTLTGVTIRNNTAGYGGGIYTRDSGQVTIVDSTVSDNTAIGGNGGGIDTWWYAKLMLAYVTITHNSAGARGGGVAREGHDNDRGFAAIVANNSPDDCWGNPSPYPPSLGYNLDSDGTCGLKQATDLPAVDPLLGLLQNNGGPTFTRALLPGSPAIDHIPAVSCRIDSDQRGVTRPQGNGCDVGAYEVQP